MPCNKQVIQQVMAVLSCQGGPVHSDRLAQLIIGCSWHPSCVGHLLAYCVLAYSMLAYFMLGHRFHALNELCNFCRLYTDVEKEACCCLTTQTGPAHALEAVQPCICISAYPSFT